MEITCWWLQVGLFTEIGPLSCFISRHVSSKVKIKAFPVIAHFHVHNFYVHCTYWDYWHQSCHKWSSFPSLRSLALDQDRMRP